MRDNLVMHFYCSECGKRLELEYPKEWKKTHESAKNPPEPTGADCLHVPKLLIKPCSHCIEKYTRPAKKLFDAINEMKVDG